MLAFEGSQHVGQLQFRPYIPHTRSPEGLSHPLFWMDFQDRTPALPEKTLALFCYHVGQVDNTTGRDSRYFGRGIGLQLLERTINWAADSGFKAIVAKGLSDFRPVIEFMGGLTAKIYQEKGFKVADSYIDRELRTVLEKILRDPLRKSLSEALVGADLDEVSTVYICVKDL